ncbi:hypothetical protein, partial [Mycobacterium marinum]|uniref:hypothetical protein n=1 Tax=Mycobacterium marinum TaxID=1781 RepID=UPI003568EDF2
ANGVFWRADSMGQLSAHYAITVNRIPAFMTIDAPVNVPITGTITDISIPAVTFPKVPATGKVDLAIISGTVIAPIGPITIHGGDASAPLNTPIVIDFGTQPALQLNLGNPDGSTVVHVGGYFNFGPGQIPLIDIKPAAGFFNATTGPSSGFFNLGDGSASGFANVGANNSGIWNVATAALGNSGFQNIGSQQSGLANLGNAISSALFSGHSGL